MSERYMKNEDRLGDMKAEVENCELPKRAYSQDFMDSTLDYMDRNDRMREEEASQLRGQEYRGRYQR
jgi:hypothetical protein